MVLSDLPSIVVNESPQLTPVCMLGFTDLAIDVPDFLDLSRLRATGLQAGEEELPDLMPPIVLPEDTRGMTLTNMAERFYSVLS